ncbi:hypothetical protein CDAR_175121 [Caerostris darwini]|uniref:Uncharacterized protein n=1 Tax=Caerostris darwini TaxID=1538125 RepID=A0AAV4W0N7_9ARAC|nr:hypothetical protein CDAR_175121 [Caerostris darwini]
MGSNPQSSEVFPSGNFRKVTSYLERQTHFLCLLFLKGKGPHKRKWNLPQRRECNQLPQSSCKIWCHSGTNKVSVIKLSDAHRVGEFLVDRPSK